MKPDLIRINPEARPMNNDHAGIKLNDALFCWLLIPFFGIAIPLITGMVDHSRMSVWQIKFSYLYTIGIAFIIYQGNRYLNFTLRSYFNWYNKPLRKILALLLVIPFYTIPVSVLMLVGWYKIFQHGVVNWSIVSTATLIILICVIFIVHVYETAFLLAESETGLVKNAQLQRAKAEAELQALKNQIDPHFIFNSLNTLSHLITEDTRKALQFNDNLADVYRYILQNKTSDLVLLREELHFVFDYFSLLKIRFGNAISMGISIDESLWDTYLIPPISLQVLLENAVKHNEFSDEYPMCINISLADDAIVVSNDIHIKKLRKASSKIGLQNLNERYVLLINKAIDVKQEAELFGVSLPILKIA
jgi:sensor histidine kinase YesM